MTGIDFGIRSVPPCGDCDTDGHCTMNCGPAANLTKEKAETLRTYASIMEKPRRYERNGPLYPAPEIAVAAAKALRFQAEFIETKCK